MNPFAYKDEQEDYVAVETLQASMKEKDTHCPGKPVNSFHQKENQRRLVGTGMAAGVERPFPLLPFHSLHHQPATLPSEAGVVALTRALAPSSYLTLNSTEACELKRCSAARHANRWGTALIWGRHTNPQTDSGAGEPGTSLSARHLGTPDTSCAGSLIEGLQPLNEQAT
eukprot:1145140-Pelagomonas_calceolata.AAC.2